MQPLLLAEALLLAALLPLAQHTAAAAAAGRSLTDTAVHRVPVVPSIVVGEPKALLSASFMEQAGFGTHRPDASLYAIKRVGGYQFFVNSGPEGEGDHRDLGGPVQSVMAGPADGRLQVAQYQSSIHIEGYPCPPGFDSTPGGCLRNFRGIGSDLWLNSCGKTPTQLWNLSAAADWTNVQSGSGACMGGVSLFHTDWERGCTASHDVVGRVKPQSSCGSLPDPDAGNHSGPCHASAWSFRLNGSIVSGLPGPSGALDQCLQAGSDNTTVVIDQ